jgi:hypothetical protein
MLELIWSKIVVDEELVEIFVVSFLVVAVQADREGKCNQIEVGD